MFKEVYETYSHWHMIYIYIYFLIIVGIIHTHIYRVKGELLIT